MSNYDTPKTNWVPADGLTDTDMNRIEGNTEFLRDHGIYRVDATGAVNAMVVTIDDDDLTAYVDGLTLLIKVNITNTGAVTVNVNGLGAKSVLTYDGNAFTANELLANYRILVSYNGINFRSLLHPTSLHASGVLGLRQVGTNTATVGTSATQLGINTTASGTAAHVEGYADTLGNLQAIGPGAHAEGRATGTGTIKATGSGAHAEGDVTTGEASLASGSGAHVEGRNNTASSTGSHAEGGGTTSSGIYAHTEGLYTTASSVASHAEGYRTQAITGTGAHAEGVADMVGNLQSTGAASHAEGYAASTGTIKATGTGSHAEGYAGTGEATLASGTGAHAEGRNNTASSTGSHAEGVNTTASSTGSHAEGLGNISSHAYAHTMGRYGDSSENYSWFVGNGTAVGSRGLGAKWLASNGQMYIDGTTYNVSGADYAEMFEWADGNLDNEDRVGLFVTTEKGKIRLANSTDDYILGIVSGNASVLGDSGTMCWSKKYLTDEFGRVLQETVIVEDSYENIKREPQPDLEIEVETVDEEGNTTIEIHYEPQPDLEVPYTETSTHEETRRVINPDYDFQTEYTPRTARPEWSAIGMMGKLAVKDDGTCTEDGFCSVDNNGMATSASEGYRVLRRVNENIIIVILK